MPTGIVFVLAGTVDPNFGWLVFLTLPIAALLGVVALVLGIIGLVFARTDHGGYTWPTVGLVLGALQFLPAGAFLTG